MWGKIIYLFPNFNGATDKIKELISNFIQHIIMNLITYSCKDETKTVLVKGATAVNPKTSEKPAPVSDELRLHQE